MSGQGAFPLRSAVFQGRGKKGKALLYRYSTVASTNASKLIWTDFFFVTAAGSPTTITITARTLTYSPVSVITNSKKNLTQGFGVVNYAGLLFTTNNKKNIVVTPNSLVLSGIPFNTNSKNNRPITPATLSNTGISYNLNAQTSKAVVTPALSYVGKTFNTVINRLASITLATVRYVPNFIRAFVYTPLPPRTYDQINLRITLGL